MKNITIIRDDNLSVLSVINLHTPSWIFFSGRTNPMVAIGSEGEGPIEIVPHDVAEIVIVRHGETTWNASGRIQVFT